MCFVCAKNNPPAKRPKFTAPSQPAAHCTSSSIYLLYTKRFKKRHVGIIVRRVSNIVNTFACKKNNTTYCEYVRDIYLSKK